MAYNNGFQYLEQRDANDNIVHAGVVSKKSPIANSDNTGIYDVIAENFRVLYDDFSSSAMARLKASLQLMYDDMRNNPQFGSTAATAQANKAIEAANKAEGILREMEATTAGLADVESYLERAHEYVDNIKDLIDEVTAAVTEVQSNRRIVDEDKKSVSDMKASVEQSETNAKASETAAKNSEDAAKYSETAAATSETLARASETAARQSENNASESETNAKTSELNAKASETAAATSESNAKQSEDNAKASEIASLESQNAAKESETNAATSESNAKSSELNASASEQAASTSESHAKASEEAAKTSEDNAAEHEQNAQAWAESPYSPDNNPDADSVTGETQSSKEWALDSKRKYILIDQLATQVDEAEKLVKGYLEQAALLKQYIDKVKGDLEDIVGSVASPMRFCGSVDNYSDLPVPGEGLVKGDMYNVINGNDNPKINPGDNVVWTGEYWDPLSGTVDISMKANKDDLAAVAMSGSYTDLSDTPTIPTTLRNPYTLTIQANGTDIGNYDGSESKTVNITPSGIGASASGHLHDDRYYTESEIDTKLSGKANSSHGNHVPTTETANNARFLRNDNTWQTVTPVNIGAAASNHTHNDKANKDDLIGYSLVNGVPSFTYTA